MTSNIEFTEEFNPEIPNVLPHDKIYSIQVGGKLFKLSGASLSSDAPSYFTDYFQQPGNIEKVLYVDRNPDVFNLIYMHLQGYHINVVDDYQFVYLFQDSFYFGLRRLQKILTNDDIFASVGNESFKLPRSLFISTGNYPNFFTIAYDNMRSNNLEVLQEKNVIRPPPQKPVTVPKRSAQLFKDLLELLKRNNLVIQNEIHRALLIKECKYYRFAELEQQIIKHKIINNPFNKKNTQDILMYLNDLSPKGIITEGICENPKESPILYRRPYIEKEPARNLLFQIDPINCDTSSNQLYSEIKMIIDIKLGVTFIKISGKMCSKFLHVFQFFESDFEISRNEIGEINYIQVLIFLKESRAVINGMEMKKGWLEDLLISPHNGNESVNPTSKRRKVNGDIMEIKISRSIWKPMSIGNKLGLHGVSFEGSTDQSSFFNQEIEFL